MRVLIVEDDATTLALLALRLRESGNEVDVAADTGLAYSKLASTTYDLVLLDYHFRDGADGLALLRAVRGRGYRGEVLMMTALGGDSLASLREKAASYGSQVLAKPFNMDNLAVYMGRAAAEGKT